MVDQDNDKCMTEISSFLRESSCNGEMSIEWLKSRIPSILKDKSLQKNKSYEELVYSRNSELRILNNRSSASRLVRNSKLLQFDPEKRRWIPKVSLPLCQGFEDYTFITTDTLKSLGAKSTKYMGLKYYERQRGEKVSANLISSRHTLVDLMSIPFISNYFTHNIVVFDGQVFLEKRQKKKANVDPYSMSGINLETILTRDHLLSKASSESHFEPAKDNAIKFNSLVHHRFPESEFSVLVSCEIDAIKKKMSPNTKNVLDSRLHSKVLNNYVEIKCRRTRRKRDLIVPLIQCYLAGTNTLVVGYRDENCYLQEVQEYNVAQLLASFEDPVYSYQFFDRWFNLIMDFIINGVDYPTRDSQTHYLMEYSKKEKNLTITPTKLNSYQVDRTVSNQFISWRKSLSTKFDYKDIEKLSLNNEGRNTDRDKNKIIK